MFGRRSHRHDESPTGTQAYEDTRAGPPQQRGPVAGGPGQGGGPAPVGAAQPNYAQQGAQAPPPVGDQHADTRRERENHGDHLQEPRRSRRDSVAVGTERQHKEYGGFNVGAAFFGWLVSLALTGLLVALAAAILSGIGASGGFEISQAEESAGVVGIVGASVLLVILMIAYFAGGYVAGRMSRFDGARQGLGTWVFGFLVTVALIVAGVVLGSQYNLIERLGIPSIPVPTDSLTIGGIIAVAVVIVGTILAAMLGGKAGNRYHRKVDRVGHLAR